MSQQEFKKKLAKEWINNKYISQEDAISPEISSIAHSTALNNLSTK